MDETERASARIAYILIGLAIFFSLVLGGIAIYAVLRLGGTL